MTLVTATVEDVHGSPDNSVWIFHSLLREASDGSGIVTPRPVRVTPVAGVLSVNLDPGFCAVAYRGKEYVIEVTNTPADLWDLIAASAAFPPGTPPTLVAAAVLGYLATHQVAARDAMNAVSDFDVRLDDNRTPIDGSVTAPKVDATFLATLATLTGAQELLNKLLTDPKVNALHDVNGNPLLAISASVGAVNTFGITNGAGGASPLLRVTGTDPNIALLVRPKGTSLFGIQDGTDTTKSARFNVSGITTATARTITVPDADITLVGTSNTQVLAGKSVDLASNTLTGTTAQFNTALSDGDFATQAGIETLPNKTLASPVMTGTVSYSLSAVLQMFNTSDQTTNYERVRHFWNSNVYTLLSEAGGTGTARAIALSSNNKTFTVAGAGAWFDFGISSTGVAQPVVRLTGNWVTSSGTATGIQVANTVAQSGTAGYTALGVNVTESSTGSGAKKLLDLEVASVSKFTVDNAGKVTLSGTAATISSGTGTPEAVVTAPVGSMYTRTDGGAGTTLYVKESGAGNTGWVGK